MDRNLTEEGNVKEKSKKIWEKGNEDVVNEKEKNLKMKKEGQRIIYTNTGITFKRLTVISQVFCDVHRDHNELYSINF